MACDSTPKGMNRMYKKAGPISVLIIVAAFMASGCGSTGQPDSSGTPGASTATTASPGSTQTVQRPTTTTAPGTTSRATGSDAICGDTGQWGTGMQSEATRGGPVSEEIYAVVAGQHSRCDRVRFDVNTPGKVDWTVKYVPELLSEAKGERIPVSGAVLQVTIQAPDFGSAATGHQPWRAAWKVGDAVIQRDGWSTFSQVIFAGSFENVAIFGIVIVGQQQHPFHVWDQQYGGSARQIVVDIAH
jgi:hypothetical protein